MPYCDSADVQSRMGGEKRLIALFGGVTSVDAAEVASCIEEADGIIDSFIGKRWATPLTSPAPKIKWLSARLAILVRKERVDMLGDREERQFEREIEMCRGIASGKELPDTTDDPETESPMVKDAYIKPDSIIEPVTRDNLEGFV